MISKRSTIQVEDKMTADESLISKTRSFGRQVSKLAQFSFICDQVRSQFSKDAMRILAAVFFISILETPKFESQPISFSTFNIIFEVISAYSCIGISVGFPGHGHSFSGELHPVSKLVLSVMCFIGRHRDLPTTERKGLEICEIIDPEKKMAKTQEQKNCQLGLVSNESDIV